MNDIEYIKELFYKESGIPKRMFEEYKTKPNENKLINVFMSIINYIKCMFGKHEYKWQGKSWKGYDLYECLHCHKQFTKIINKYIEY